MFLELVTAIFHLQEKDSIHTLQALGQAGAAYNGEKNVTVSKTFLWLLFILSSSNTYWYLSAEGH